VSRQSFQFEDDVRRAAEAVWGLKPGECQPTWYLNDPVLHELDGIAELRDMTHVIMATTDTGLAKVKSDVAKLNAAARQETGKRNLPVEKWLITEQQLHAEHVKYAREHNVKLLTLAQFRNRFFDGLDYITKRRRAPFGSARNLVDGSVTVPDDEYVELPMVGVNWTAQGWRPGSPVDLRAVADRLVQGEWFVLLGPFGAGKSLTTRQLFYDLSDRARHLNHSQGVPVAINLREHWGALYGDEVLERHARSIGLTRREDLTIAWRAGIVCLLLDGFDEVASQAIARPTDRNWTQQARFEALNAVRDLVGNLPSGSGLLVSGRDHYFDDGWEMEHALGLTGRAYSIVRLEEFTEDQATEYLARHGAITRLPDWLPRKPLILGYLAHRGLLPEVLKIDGSRGFGFVWDQFLDLICEREAQLDRAAMDPRTVRRVLERLAAVARSTSSGAGPLTSLDIAESYRAETGDAAGEGVLMQLQRLPGLTPREQDPTARSFVDLDLLSALQGSAVARAVTEGDASVADRRWLDGLTPHGVHMAAHILREHGFDAATVLASSTRFAEARAEAPGKDQLAADCLAVALELARDTGELDARSLSLSGVAFCDLDLEDLRVLNLSITDSVIETILVDRTLAQSTLRIANTEIGRMVGVPSEEGLPMGIFVGCSVTAFDDTSTNAALLRLNLSPSMKALMTVLRKLYMQAGRGRRLNALTRGLPSGSVTDAVAPILDALEAEGLVHVVGEVAHPVRRQSARVQRILAAGGLSDDPLVVRIRSL